jgi:cytochrome P450
MTPVIGKVSEDGRRGVTKNEVLTNGLAFVIANSQLSTIAMTTATYLLLQYPQTLQHLAAEIRNSSFADISQIKVASTQSLPYLNAVISETLRLHHPTPGSLPRIVPDEGISIDGSFVPGGYVVGVSLYNIHNRNENFFQPREFHPERFLDKTDIRYDEAFDRDRLEAFQPFSTGPRNCIGGK